MNEHNSVTPSDFQRGSAAELLSYMEKENGAKIRDRTGQEVDSDDIQRFIDKSEKHEMSRHVVISCENAESLSRETLSDATKRTLRDTLGQREGVDYLYSVHTDGGDRKHAHVAATGRANGPGDPLWLDADDLEMMADTAHEHSKHVEQGLELDLEKSVEKSSEKSQHQER